VALKLIFTSLRTHARQATRSTFCSLLLVGLQEHRC